VNVDLGINNQWNGDAAWDNVMNVENIIGSSFNDQLIGDAGANQISGGAGNDSITGGLGSELFVYKAVSDSGIGLGNRDIITDFSRAQGDRIDLSAFTGTFGFLGTGAFTGGTTPQVRYVNDGTNTILQVNTNNDTIADFEIQVNGQVAFVSGDFVL
jgi:Peptidase M10 serralysin C terminal.